MADRQIALSGPITLATAHLWVDRYPEGSGDVVVDASKVTESDSALIALLLAWRRRAHRQGVKWRVCHPPAAAVELARIYGVQTLLFS